MVPKKPLAEAGQEIAAVHSRRIPLACRLPQQKLAGSRAEFLGG